MEEILLFFLSFIFIYLFYQFFFVAPHRKNKSKKELIEIRYLMNRYSIDMDKISYLQLLQLCAIVSSIDIAIVVSIIALIHNFWLKLLIGFLLIFILIITSYHFVYLFYKRKGMIKDGKNK